MRALELARARGVRAGEGAALDAEELGLDELVGQRRTVDRDEGLVLARAHLVQRAREALLADAGLAEQQHRDVGRRRATDEVVGVQEGGGAADEVGGAARTGDRAAHGLDLLAQLEQAADDRVGLEVGQQRVRVGPVLGRPADDAAVSVPGRGAFGLAEQDETSVSLKREYGEADLPENRSNEEEKPSTIIHVPGGEVVIPADTSPVAMELVDNMEFIRERIKALLSKKNNKVEYGGVILRKTEQAPQELAKYKVLRINVTNPQKYSFTFPQFYTEDGHVYAPKGTKTGVIPPNANYTDRDAQDLNYEVIAMWHSHPKDGDATPSPEDIKMVNEMKMPDVMIHKYHQKLHVIDMKSRTIDYPYLRRRK